LRGFVRDLAHRRKALLETLHIHKKKTEKNVRKKPIFTNLKKRFEHIELPAKLLDYFLPSHKSNINQSVLNNLSKQQHIRCWRI